MLSLVQEVNRIMKQLPPIKSVDPVPPPSPPSPTPTPTPPPPSPSKATSEIRWQQLSEPELEELIAGLPTETIRQLKHMTESSAKTCDAVDLKHPFSMLIAGASGLGKTVLVKRILESDIISPPPEKVVWCYAEYQTLYDEMKDAGLVDEFIEGLDYEKHVDGITPTLLVIDDLQDETSSDSDVANLFKRGCHHRNISVMFIVQNLYFQGKKSVDIRRNAKYVAVFKNPQDKLQMQKFVQGSFPNKAHQIMQLYENLEAHGYLLFDFTADADDDVRIRTGITKGENFECYI